MAEYKLSQNTDEFQELLEIFWETYRFNSREFFTLTCIYTSRLQKRGFLCETGVLPGLTISTSHFTCVLSVLFFSFWIDRASTSTATLEIEANAVIYIAIQKSSYEAGFLHKPELVCCEA